MSTPNFIVPKNADHYFVLRDEEDIFLWDDKVNRVVEELEKIGFYSCLEDDLWLGRESRIIAGKGVDDGIGVMLGFDVVLHNGYYTGANLDYVYKVSLLNDGTLLDEDLENDLKIRLEDMYWYDNKVDYKRAREELGMPLRIYRKKAVKWVYKTLEEEHKKIMKVFEEVSDDVLVRMGVFSNGEAVYHSIRQ